MASAIRIAIMVVNFLAPLIAAIIPRIKKWREVGREATEMLEAQRDLLAGLRNALEDENITAEEMTVLRNKAQKAISETTQFVKAIKEAVK
ncbi:MAG: hypothetical protein ABIH46_05685 [Chloroflexota bacterium]